LGLSVRFFFFFFREILTPHSEFRVFIRPAATLFLAREDATAIATAHGRAQWASLA
jgi:hypothetical protein